jgi:phage-related protein
MQRWQIDFYETKSGNCPVLEFIRTLPKEERVRLGHAIDDLERNGPALRMPQSRPILSKESLFELRISGEQNIYRVLYFHFTGKTFILLHAFIKKSQKTPEKEINIALERLKDFKQSTKETR